jgi:hypothetical protein
MILDRRLPSVVTLDPRSSNSGITASEDRHAVAHDPRGHAPASPQRFAQRLP